jgi:hypothetical protein
LSVLHLRKTNSPGSDPPSVDWIATFDDKTGICTYCTTAEGEPSVAFIGKHRSFIDQWLDLGVVDGIAYHEIIEELPEVPGQ